MNELFQGGEKPQEAILSVTEGQIFLPFKNSMEFIPVDLDESFRIREDPPVLKQEIEFKGVSGAVIIYASPNPSEEKPLTPLGAARLVTSYKDGGICLTEAPCYLQLDLDIRDQGQYDLLRKYQAQFFLNDEVFYLYCDGGTDPEFAFHEFKNGEYVFAADWNLKDKDGKKVEVLLPQNLTILSGIRMRIVEFDDDEDFEEEMTPPSVVPDLIPSP